MKKLLSLLIFASASMGYAQYGSIHGVVLGEQHKPLTAANIVIQESSIGTFTKEDGSFHFDRIDAGQHHITVSYIGYKSITTKVQVWAQQTTRITIELAISPLPFTEINITSLRFQTDLNDVSIPMNVVGADKIAATAPVTVSDALQEQSGVSLHRDGIWGTSISIRGLSRNSIVTLIDGNRIDTATDLAAGLSLFDLYNIERIEVIKSAASALYGSGAMGGVVNIISKQGWYQEKVYAKANLIGGYASANRGAMGHFRMQAGGRNWYSILSGSLRQADDMRTPRGVLSNSQFEDDHLSLRQAFKPFENHEIKLDYQRSTAYDVGIPGGNPLFPSQAKVTYPKEKRELASLEYNLKRPLSFLTHVSMKIFSQNILRDVENIPFMVNNIPATDTTPAKRVSVLEIKPGATHDTEGLQLQTQWLSSADHFMIFGLDAWQKDYKGHRSKTMQTDILNPDGSVKSTMIKTVGDLPLPDSYYRSIGVYAQDEWRLLSNRLALSLGGRIDEIKTQNERALNPVYEIVNGVRNDHPQNQQIMWPERVSYNRSWSVNFGGLIHANKNLDVTLNLAKSFRAPSLEERYQYIDLGNMIKLGDPDLKPEQGNYIDFGIRLFFDRVNFSGNLFYNKLSDLVTESTGTFEGRSALYKANIGEATLYGSDFSMELNPVGNQIIYLQGSYVHGQDDVQNVPLPQIAPLNGSIGIRSAILPLCTTQLSAIIFADQERIAEGEIKTGGYSYFNFYINSKPFRVAGLQMSLMVGVENFTDKTYRNHLATNRGEINIEPGRNFIGSWRIGM
ncbi:TonB-dependent receptor [candidate division KSB1 bacterium]|nr:TonB-dependent receptor [candidate division KSB1 bacterium]